MQIQENINWWYDWEKSFLDSFKVDKKEYFDLYKSQKWKIIDFAWYTYNLFLTKVAEAYQGGNISEVDFYDSNHIIYGQMTAFLVQFENKRGTDTWKLSNVNYVKYCQLQFENIEGFEVFCVSCCKPCDSFYKMKLTIAETLQHINTIEERCCAKYGGHRTSYFAIVPEDPNSPIKIVMSVT